MKKIIALVLFTLSFAVSANPDPLDLVGDRCAPGDVLFYGQTQDHKKEVLVCQWNTTVFYRFGKVGKNLSWISNFLPKVLTASLMTTVAER